MLAIYPMYGLRGSWRLAGDWISTRISFPNARLVRRPFYVRGRRWIRLGAGFTSGPGLRIDAFPLAPTGEPTLTIGRAVQVNDYVHIGAVLSVTIGDRTLIASKVFIGDHNHGSYSGVGEQSDPSVPPQQRALSAAAVHIAEDVWIGESVAVMPGVTIGKGAVIGAMSVVTHDVPPYCIAIGSPARVVKRYDPASRRWLAE